MNRPCLKPSLDYPKKEGYCDANVKSFKKNHKYLSNALCAFSFFLYVCHLILKRRRSCAPEYSDFNSLNYFT